ncbi:MAG: hypothetical protein EA377_02955 [Phycisphaerales bacterium]|nr:MAG: hypothetical protein EA377_02955 [Phycisphaerales bacterium]
MFELVLASLISWSGPSSSGEMSSRPVALGFASVAPARYRFWHPINEAPSNEAGVFFERLIERYRRLSGYADTTSIVQTLQHDGSENEQRIETTVQSEVTEGQLRVHTSTSSLADAVTTLLPLRWSDRLHSLRQQYDFWLVPHLSLTIQDDVPFRRPDVEGRTLMPQEIRSVTINERPLWQLLLVEQPDSSDPDLDPDASATARFEVYVDPASMLIERVDGQQQLADGTSSRTTAEIRPTLVRESDPDGTGDPSPVPDAEGESPDDAPDWGPPTVSDETSEKPSPRPACQDGDTASQPSPEERGGACNEAPDPPSVQEPSSERPAGPAPRS